MNPPSAVFHEGFCGSGQSDGSGGEENWIDSRHETSDLLSPQAQNTDIIYPSVSPFSIEWAHPTSVVS